MKLHFRIQWNIIKRYIKDSGLNPIVTCIVVAALFVFLTYQLFTTYEYASYIYIFVSLYFVLRLSKAKRNEFLAICFGERERLGIRLLENILYSIPFLLGLVIFENYFMAGVLLLLNMSLILLKLNDKAGVAFPTPFRRYSFEFVVGFRKTLWLLILSFSLGVAAAIVANANLGIFALSIALLNTLSFYSSNEDSYYVWVYAESAKVFLLKKIRTAVLLNTLLHLVLSFLLILFFPEEFYLILALNVMGNILLSFVIVLKYAAFPNQISLKENISLGLTIFFPPIVIFLFPYYYNQSVKSLKTVLQ